MKLKTELNVVISGLIELQNEINFQVYIDETKQTGGYKDLKTRVVWDLYFILCHYSNLLPEYYTDYLRKEYNADDSHIDTLLKKAIDSFKLNF